MMRRLHSVAQIISGRLASVHLIVFSLGILVPLTVSGGLISPTVSADSPPAVPKDCQSSFFGLVPWYHYIGNELTASGPDGHCDVQCFNIMDQGTNSDGTPKTNHCGQSASDIPLVLLAIVDDLLRVAGLAAVAFVIYGAFRYTASQGDPEQTAKAQATIINALIGTAVAVSAVAFVSFLGSKLGS